MLSDINDLQHDKHVLSIDCHMANEEIDCQGVLHNLGIFIPHIFRCTNFSPRLNHICGRR